MYSIRPLSAISREAVIEYLLSQRLSREVIEWKYFDPQFGMGRERGHVVVQDEKVAGFLGLIPFSVTNRLQRLQVAWSCDWFRDASVPGISAIMLIKESVRRYDAIYSLGGSATTAAILPRLARQTFRHAAITLHRPLSLRVLTEAGSRKLGIPSLARLSPLLNLPLIARTRPPSAPNVSITHGLSSDLAMVLSEPEGDPHARTEYDFAYIDWQLGRCPEVVSCSCLIRGRDGSHGAILFWRHVESIDFWRLAIVKPSRIASDELYTALRLVLQHLSSQGASLVSVLVSQLETNVLQLLKTLGFIASRRYLPLYVLPGANAGTYDQISELSYLDTDLGYRFSILGRH